MKSSIESFRMSPKKVNLLAGLIRNKTCQDALDFLRFANKKSAKVLYKLVKGALANAINNFSQSESDLYIKNVIVTKGTVFKRGRSSSKGRVMPLLKRTSNIYIELGINY